MADKVVIKNGLPIRMKDIGDGTYQEVVATEINGSLAKLAEIKTNTVITAGSSVTVLVNNTGRLEYKTLRGTVRFADAATFNLILWFRTAANTSTTAGNTSICTGTDKQILTGEARIDGEYYDVAISNTGAVDETLQYCSILGVK